MFKNSVVTLAALTASALLAPVHAQDLEIVPVRGNIYMLAGAGANITVSIGYDGIFLVDTGSAQMTDRVIATINRLNQQLSTVGKPIKSETRLGTESVLTGIAPPKPIRYIANTSALPDHVGGNEKLATIGKTYTGGNVTGEIANASEGAAILSHEDALQRMSDAKMPGKSLPTETYFGGVMKLSHFFNGEGVVLYHIANANNDGDSLVQFRGSDVVAAGDIFDFSKYPLIDVDKGGSVQGVLAGLNRLLDMVVAEFRSEGGTLIVPGHGRVCDTADLAYYRDMVTIIRDRIQDMMKKDMSLAQIKAARPTEDWDGRFGSTTGAWTTDMFVEAIYKSLSRPPSGKKP